MNINKRAHAQNKLGWASQATLALSLITPVSLLLPSLVFADDVVVDTTETTTQILLIGDTLTVTETGSIKTASGIGVYANDNIGSLSNSGTILAGDSGIIVDGDLGSLSNSGTISGEDSGVNVYGDLGSLANSGKISGEDSAIIVYGDLGSLTNSGTILGEADGFFVFGGAFSITNSGTISGEGDGIYVGDNLGSLSNSGTISGEDDGIYVDSDLGSLTNSGIISGEYHGVSVDGDVGSLSNSGTISSGEDAIVADSITTITNSGSILGGDSGVSVDGDIGSLSNSGTISGEDSAIIVDGDVGSLSNNGTILGEYGIVVGGDIGGLSNSGTIEGDIDGIHVDGDIVSLENSGTISGAEDDGIQADNILNLNNSGTIEGAYGVFTLENIENLVNSGTISGGGDGILVYDDIGSLNNSGTISGGNDGVYVGGDIGNLVNSGTIEGGDLGIYIDGNSGESTITNSGIISGGDDAIYFGSADADTLNLEAGSIISGSVYMNGSNDTINFGPGLSSVITLSGDEPGTTNFSSPVNFSDATTRAQADVTTMGAFGDVLDDVRDGISSVVRTRLQTATMPYEEGASSLDHTKYWVSGWGTSSDTEGEGFAHSSGGAIAGADWSFVDGDYFGVYGGAGAGSIDTDIPNGQEIETKSVYLGVYGKRNMGNGQINVDFLVGQMSFDSQRSVDAAIAEADYDAWFIAPSIGYSQGFSMGEKNLLTTTSLGYAGLFIDSYDETGSAGNLSVDSRNIHQLNLRTELSLVIEGDTKAGYAYEFSPYIGVEGRFNIGDDEATVNFLGNSVTFNPGGDDSVGSAFIGFKFSRELTPSSEIFGSIEGGRDTNSDDEITGQVGFAMKF
ncbi:MAG: autotransporter outer membrane beta-barrel domain-containing protein [Maribacter stanieri]